MTGKVDDVSVWSRALSVTEILNIIDTQSINRGVLTSSVFDAKKAINWNQLSWETVSPTLKPLLKLGGGDSGYQQDNFSMSGVLHHFNFDEGVASASFLDSSGLSHDSSCTTCPSSGDQGRLNSAVALNGIDQFIEVPHHSDFEVDNGTISIWFRPENLESGTGSQYLWSKDSSDFDTGGHLSIGFTTALKPHVRIQSDTTSYSATGSIDVVSDKWQHMAVSFGALGLRLFYNGVLVASDNYTGGLSSASSGGMGGNLEPIAIGGGTGSSGDTVVTPVLDFFAGKIDEVIFLNSQLSDASIQTLYRRGANALKIQLRACQKADCSDASFVGPDGSTSSYFTEEGNSSAGLPSFNFSGLFSPSKYFQYQATLESLELSDSPKLKSVVINGSE